VEGEGVGRGVPSPILKREREEEQRDSSLGVIGEVRSPTVKHPPGTSSSEGEGGERSAGHNPEVHLEKGMNISQVATWEERLGGGFGSSSEESAGEGEGVLRDPQLSGSGRDSTRGMSPPVMSRRRRGKAPWWDRT